LIYTYVFYCEKDKTKVLLILLAKPIEVVFT